MFDVTSDVPMPRARNAWRIELDKLDVGDSFPFDGTPSEIAYFRVSVGRSGRALKKEFTVRADSFSGVRCWRIR
jgi:hypothetical protein